MKTNGPTMRMTNDCARDSHSLLMDAIADLGKKIDAHHEGRSANARPRLRSDSGDVFGSDFQRETAALAALNDAHRRHYGRPAPRTWGRA